MIAGAYDCRGVIAGACPWNWAGGIEHASLSTVRSVAHCGASAGGGGTGTVRRGLRLTAARVPVEENMSIRLQCAASLTLLASLLAATVAPAVTATKRPDVAAAALTLTEEERLIILRKVR